MVDNGLPLGPSLETLDHTLGYHPGVLTGTLNCSPRSFWVRSIVLSQGQRENNDLVASPARPPHERWLPNREQLAVLEDLYSKGTMPSQENIAEAVSLVGHDHGPVSESKVYFWFQNKKARERRQRRRIEEANAASGACASAIATTAAASASSGKSSAEEESMNHIISIGFSFPALLARNKKERRKKMRGFSFLVLIDR
ncbi:WUSCHEL-related homeobox 6 [Selaginella moellendorffii]|uniref:WUSCHEL-related homeobox 6 n=1 Tax=Selaginella moellendorffii TaxID=88036 RepID=UPI000D1C426A|nr:WUSCHEL-related homeobox 6 [Selaginella moellendorffii]|eukprot:XP_024529082.1 WUSCHEL-related homeobox 6 [Selaginella moellendorffii]